MLFCGWRRDLDDMITELDKVPFECYQPISLRAIVYSCDTHTHTHAVQQCVCPGSELHILSTIPSENRLRLLLEGGLDTQLKNLKLVHHLGNPVMRRHLEALPLETFESILILAEQSVRCVAAHFGTFRQMHV